MPNPPDPIHFSADLAHNAAALEELVGAIALGQGADAMTLVLVRCNYAQLRERILTALLAKLADEDLQGEVHVLRLGANERNLYSLVQGTAEHQRPGAVIVLQTEGVQSLETLLVEVNKRREEFRRDFPFPLVLWFTDAGYHQLSQFANDFESVAGGETIEFELPAVELAQRLQEAAQQMFDGLLAPNTPESFNRRLKTIDLGYLGTEEIAIALTDLQAQGHVFNPDLQASIAFAQGLNVRNEEAIALFEQSADHWQSQPNNPDARLKQGLSLFYVGRSRYFAIDNSKYQDPNWADAAPPLEACLQIFEQANRSDLVAKSITQLERLLHRLQRWDELDTTAQRALPLHQRDGNFNKLAQDYGFLADVALHRQQWQSAAELAQQALDTLAQLPEVTWWRILYLKMLAEAKQALGQTGAATDHLRDAQAMGVMEHPKLHSDVLALLQQRLRDQGQYLEAFEVKRERLAVEKQYGLRAFIGAGRLRSQRTEQRPTVRSERETLEDIAPEIASSGRFQDLQKLLNRIAGTSHKLIVLHGASGVGKSSLVNGGLVPALTARALENRDNVPVLIRRYTHWQQEISNALEAINRVPTPPPPGRDAINRVPTALPTVLNTLRQCETLTYRVVLIFDQFEEFFFANTDPLARRDFFQFIADCLELPGALKIVFSLREDYIHYLLEARQLVKRTQMAEGSMARSQLEDILGKQILYEIGNFSPADTKAIIGRLAAGARMHLEPALVDALVADLAGSLGEVRPIEMQIVGAQLQTDGIQTLDHYRQLGDQPKETLVQRYLEDVVADCGEENRQLAELVLFLLTDERGTRPLKTRPELVRELEALGITAGSPLAPLNKGGIDSPPLSRGDGGILDADNTPLTSLDLVLHILCGSGIAMQLPDTPDDRYQLVHDYLAGVIRERQAPRLEVLMAELEEEKRQRQRLEQEKVALTTANEQAKAELVSVQVERQDLQRKNQQARRGLAITVGAAAVVAALTGGTALISTNRARLAQAEAIEIQNNAEQEQITADFAVVRADFNVGAADIREVIAIRQSEAAIEREEKAQQEVEAANAELAEIDQRAKQEQQAAQAEVERAQAEVAMAQVASQQAQVDLAQARAEREAAVREQEIAIQERGTARQGTALEREAIRIFSRFSSLTAPDRVGQLEQLIAAVETGKRLEALTQANTKLVDYAALSPVYTLGQILQDIREQNRLSHGAAIWSVAFSPDGSQILTGSDNGEATLWSRGGEQIAQFSHGDAVSSVAFSPDGRQILMGSFDGEATLWSQKGEQIAKFSHDDFVYSVAFSPDGSQILTGSRDSEAILWSLQGEQIAQFSHGDFVSSVAFSPDGSQILTGSMDGKATLWSLQGEQIAQLSYGDVIWSLAFSPDGSQILTGSMDGKATLWSRGGEQIAQLSHSAGVRSVAFSSDGSQILTGSVDGEATLWSRGGEQIAQLSYGDVVWSVAFSPDGSHILMGSRDGKATLWSWGGEQIAQFSHEDVVYSVAFSPDGSQILTGSGDFLSNSGEATLWSLHGEQIAQLRHGDAVRSVAFSPDGRQILTGSSDGEATLWSLGGEQIARLSHEDVVRSVAFSPDGRQILTGSFDGKATLWSRGGEQIAQFSHGAAVRSVAFSPDGRQILTGSSDGEATLWSREGEQISQFSHGDAIFSVAFSPDGRQILTGSGDGEATLRPVPTIEGLLARGCNWLRDYLTHNPNVSNEDRALCNIPPR